MCRGHEGHDWLLLPPSAPPQKIVGYRREMLKHTDQRVKLMNQLLVSCEARQLWHGCTK